MKTKKIIQTIIYYKNGTQHLFHKDINIILKDIRSIWKSDKKDIKKIIIEEIKQ